MTDHFARLYAIAIALAVFFSTWAVVAAKPWAAEASANDLRLVALERREERLRRQSVRVQRLVKRRFAAYQVRLKKRQAEIAAVQAANARAAAAPAASSGGASSGGGSSAGASAPSVGVVSLPPVTSSGTS